MKQHLPKKEYGKSIIVDRKSEEEREYAIAFRKSIDKMWAEKYPQPDFILVTENELIKHLAIKINNETKTSDRN